MAPILTPEDVVRRIAAECTFIRRAGRRRDSTGTGRRDRTAVRGAIPRTIASAVDPLGETAASALTGRWCFGVLFEPSFCNA